jgi:hypothetical protein
MKKLIKEAIKTALYFFFVGFAMYAGCIVAMKFLVR